MEQPIDIVMPWVDGNDSAWIEQKEKYVNICEGDKRINRFREWGNLQYIFRGIEKYLPWVRKIHFITWGHLPEWINTEHPKLNIVKHEEYIPEKYLPTFSANPIELNVHRIKGLAEQFIYTNDDMFFISPLKKSDFFRNGLPCDTALESVHQFKKGGIDHIVANDLEIINGNFDKRTCLKKNLHKYYALKYGKGLLKNLYLMPLGHFAGFENPHIPISYRKDILEEIWEKETETLDQCCKNRFRSNSDVNQWLIRYWQFASGRFFPVKKTNSKFYSIGKDDKSIEDAIKNQKFKMICLSDDDVTVDFDKEREFIIKCFESIFPEKSKYEK